MYRQLANRRVRQRAAVYLIRITSISILARRAGVNRLNASVPRSNASVLLAGTVVNVELGGCGVGKDTWGP